MTRLEQLVEQMESDQLPLEDLLNRYEEGVKLVKACEEKLAAAEKRVEVISREAIAELAAEPLEPKSKLGAAVAQPNEANLL